MGPSNGLIARPAQFRGGHPMNGLRLGVSLLLPFTLVTAGFSQVTATGSLAGRVVDKSQAVINGAVVRLSNAGSGLQRETRSADEGLFQFEQLPAGSYEVTVEMPGFAK